MHFITIWLLYSYIYYYIIYMNNEENVTVDARVENARLMWQTSSTFGKIAEICKEKGIKRGKINVWRVKRANLFSSLLMELTGKKRSSVYNAMTYRGLSMSDEKDVIQMIREVIRKEIMNTVVVNPVVNIDSESN